MKIYQLIEKLKKYDQELDVIVEGYEGGTDPISKKSISLVYVDKAAGQTYYGDYGDPEDSPYSMKEPLLAILIKRGYVDEAS